MKAKNEVLKQARICSHHSVEQFATKLKLSEGYVSKLEAGEINNLDYIYPKYSEALRVPLSRIKRIIAEAEKGKWDETRIRNEVFSMFDNIQ